MKWLMLLFLLKIKDIYATDVTPSPTPIVIWHGMGDTCCYSFSLGKFKEYLERKIPGVYVLSLRIGKSTVEDFANGYFMNPNNQIKLVCNKLASDRNLRQGFNAIGFSQGSQFLRGVIQRCGHRLPPVKNFISMGGQHQGVYGLPHCGTLSEGVCDYLRKILNYAAYASWVQRGLVQATYWHDPLNEDTYRYKSIFLSDINNEKQINQTYINNLNSLAHLVLVKFNEDTIVVPKDTEWFEFYKTGQSTKIVPLTSSRIYLEDRLGLKSMNEAGKLVLLDVPGDHLQFSEEWFEDSIIKKYLL